MSSKGLAVVALLACVLTFTAAQSSCRDRCGLEYNRAHTCQCDYNCLLYGECCKDYERLCTSKNSCKGRCGEKFKRGRTCSCDADCVKYNQCCPDHKEHCAELDEVHEEESVATPVKHYSCDINVEKKPTEPTPEATEQPIERPSTSNEGNDAADNIIPTLNPTSYPQDDPNSASDPASPEQIPLVEGSSGSPPTDLLEDFTAEPALPDLDGFEIPPLSVTDSTETTATTAGSTTVGPSTAHSTAGSTDVDNHTISPEPTTMVNIISTQPTSAPITSFTGLQTDPTQTDEALTMTSEPTLPSSAPSTLTPEITNTPKVTEQTTTLKDEPSTTPESTEPSTAAPTTTATQKIDSTELPNPTTPASGDAVSESETTTAKEQDVTSGPTSSPMTKPTEKPLPEKPLKPVLGPEHKPVLNGLGVDPEYQADDSNDTNLCSGRPISGLTTLSNGTVVVFRGPFFWVLDRNRAPGPARGITQVWGIPSPIDTVFTRCNCQGKTYIFKGPQYWRFENDVLDPGYPKVVETGFDGLRGHITAALSVPQHNQRKESVYFFKRGGNVQKYSYQSGTNPSCGRKVHYAVYTHRNRIARQVPAQVSLLEPSINYRTSWRSFPTTITAAVSIPNKREPEGYSYYVFSRSKSYRIRMDGERPVVIASKPEASSQSNEVFKCPKKVSRSQ